MTFLDSMTALEQVMKTFPDRIEVVVTLNNHEDVPDGFIPLAKFGPGVYEKIVESKNGIKMKTISLYNPK